MFSFIDFHGTNIEHEFPKVTHMIEKKRVLFNAEQ